MGFLNIKFSHVWLCHRVWWQMCGETPCVRSGVLHNATHLRTLALTPSDIFKRIAGIVDACGWRSGRSDIEPGYFYQQGVKWKHNMVGIPRGRVMRFAKVLLCVVALLPLSAQAGRITMSNPDEQELQGGKRLCIYESSIYLFTLVTRSQSCPYSRTFDTNDNEK